MRGGRRKRPGAKAYTIAGFHAGVLRHVAHERFPGCPGDAGPCATPAARAFRRGGRRSWTVRPGNMRFRAYHTFELFATLRVGAGVRAAPVLRSADSVVGLTDAVQVTHVFISAARRPLRARVPPASCSPADAQRLLPLDRAVQLTLGQILPFARGCRAPWRYNVAHNHRAAHEGERLVVITGQPANIQMAVQLLYNVSAFVLWIASWR